jgi:DNA-binding ferritin-like protein
MQTKSNRMRLSKRTRKHQAKQSQAQQSQSPLRLFIPTFLHMLNTVKLYHWKTTSYSTHKATDQLYSDLNENIDEFVEILLGKPNITIKSRNALLNVTLIKLHHYNNNEEFKKQIEYYKSFLMNFSNIKSFNIPSNSDLINKRDEILGVFNQFLYLITLKE